MKYRKLGSIRFQRRKEERPVPAAFADRVDDMRGDVRGCWSFAGDLIYTYLTQKSAKHLNGASRFSGGSS